jgi:hypothetical protein
MAQHNNKSIGRIFVTYHSENCWAHLGDIGWKKVKTGNPSGVTNVHVALTAGRANGRTVTVITDSADTNIEQVYL